MMLSNLWLSLKLNMYLYIYISDSLVSRFCPTGPSPNKRCSAVISHISYLSSQGSPAGAAHERDLMGTHHSRAHGLP